LPNKHLNAAEVEMNIQKVFDDICELSISLDCSAVEILELITGVLLSEEEAGQVKELGDL
jgi:hypothetical protein